MNEESQPVVDMLNAIDTQIKEEQELRNKVPSHSEDYADSMEREMSLLDDKKSLFESYEDVLKEGGQ
ncbi:hypothetical protein JOC34_000636 [Virgibacillus halotolerans]|uniref:hypothetical protein n=1 Tax=Virgibacillus halotolerans TaxID=1071053 RepID=UPI001961E6F1|nr:hypothetical protein [Virgibacillus halotolerans]MBM7598279.1 hypothetical protein [Virgibacillus halotolerans]